MALRGLPVPVSGGWRAVEKKNAIEGWRKGHPSSALAEQLKKTITCHIMIGTDYLKDLNHHKYMWLSVVKHVS